MLWIIAAADLILNIPFGYWRENTKKFSLHWFLAIHLPIPFVVIMRIYSGLGFKLTSFLVTLSAYLLGQFIGGKLNKKSRVKK